MPSSHYFVNIAILGAVALGLIAARRLNPFECVLMLGRMFFALMIAMAFFGLAGQAIASTFNLPLPYASAIAFCGIWLLVVSTFDGIAIKVAKHDGRGMKFTYSPALRTGLGLLSGLLAGAAVGAFAVMLPPVEGLYFRNNTVPVANFHRMGGRIYGVMTLTFADPVAAAHMQAGAYWAKRQMQRAMEANNLQKAAELKERFATRYRVAHLSRKDMALRERLYKELEDLTSRRLASAGSGPTPAGAEAPQGPPGGTGPPQPTLGPATAGGGAPLPPQPGPLPGERPVPLPAVRLDLRLVDFSPLRELVLEGRVGEAMEKLRAYRGESDPPEVVRQLDFAEGRLRALLQLRADLVRRVEGGDHRALPPETLQGRATLVGVDDDGLVLQDESGGRGECKWAGLDAVSLACLFGTYFQPGDQRLKALMEELFLPNCSQLEVLAEALAKKDREVDVLVRSGFAAPEVVNRAKAEQEAVVRALYDALGPAAELHRKWRENWISGVRAGKDLSSPELVRDALAMQFVVRAAAPWLKRLSYEQIVNLFGDRLMLHVGGGVFMDFVLVRPGAFRMGNSDVAQNVAADELPVHEVRITRPFYMSVYETTVSQYAQVMHPAAEAAELNLPVSSVSWTDASEFCRRLSARTGLDVRLPTEAQWEYACRAGADSTTSSEQRLSEVAWYAANSDRTKSPVGKKRPNAWGLYDMLGNVAEWCRDWYGEDYYSYSRTDDPAGPRQGTRLVFRGGSFLHNAAFINPARRFSGPPDTSLPWLGFRPVIELNP